MQVFAHRPDVGVPYQFAGAEYRLTTGKELYGRITGATLRCDHGDHLVPKSEPVLHNPRTGEDLCF